MRRQKPPPGKRPHFWVPSTPASLLRTQISRGFTLEEGHAMCRNIRPLFNFEPAATNDEIRAASLQFVRKVSGFTKPSHANQAAFDRAVEEVAHAIRHLVADLTTSAPARDREVETAKAKARSQQRFGTSPM